MRLIGLFLILISLYSCSPEKRLSRLILKHPELLTKDTLYIHDTIRLASHSIDTIIQNVIGDTITIQDSVMVIKYVNNGKTVYLKGTCKERNIIVEKKIPFEKVVAVTKEVKPWYLKYLWWWLILTLGVIIGRFAWNFILKYLNLR